MSRGGGVSIGDVAVVGRQGIRDDYGLLGYELLFRNVQQGRDRMTADVVYGAVSIGLSRVVGDQLIFCNVGPEVLAGEIPLLLSPDQTVIEVDNDCISDVVLDGCKKFVEAGYRLALDDFKSEAGHLALLPLASIVKIDSRNHSEDLAELIGMCSDHSVRLLADKVDDRDDMPRLKDLGFELFQGHALDRPVLIQGRALDPADVTRVNAAVDVLKQEPDFDELEDMLRVDPVLAHQVMSLASIGRIGETRRRFNSIRDALVMTGIVQIRKWLALLLTRPAGEQDEETREAFLQTLTRARACELIAAKQDGCDPKQAFTAGMLSSLDVLLQVSPDEIAARLNLGDELVEAAFGDGTPLARIVRDVAEYGAPTTAGEDIVAPYDTRSGVSVEALDESFATAFAWAFEVSAAEV